MMKSIVRSSAESEGKTGVESVFKHFGDVCGFFAEKTKKLVKKVEVKVVEEGSEEALDTEDYTTEAELKALHAHLKLQEGYVEYNHNLCMSINVEEYYR